MKKVFPFYPLLLGVVWVLATYSNNVERLPSIASITAPLLVVVSVTAAVLGSTQLLVKDWKKSALVTAVILTLTIFHGYIRDFTNTDGLTASPIWLALMVAGVLVVLKLTRSTGRLHLTIIANVVSISILLVTLVGIFTSTAVSADREYPYTPSSISSVHNPTPDVYYIIPDTFTNLRVLENYLDYDFGDEFYDFLYSRGFHVSPTSYANYHNTILSISSVLNMKYWTDEDLGSSPAYFLGRSLFQNPVVDTFKEAGYTYAHIGSWWDYTATNVRSDVTYRYSTLSELSFALYRTTLWYDLADIFDKGGNSILRSSTLGQFDSLVEVSKMEDSTFTFAHILLPHPPFLFDSEGGYISAWMVPPEEWRSYYLGQLEYTTKLIESTIDQILANSKVPPIIIVASDEGYGGTDWQNYWQEAKGLDSIWEDRPDLVIKRQGAFYAILNPYGGSFTLPKSPVNTFMYVFNSLFGSGLEYLPDRYFLRSLGEYPGKFIEITDKLR